MATERTAMTPDGSVVHLDSDNTYMYDYGATVNGDIAGGPVVNFLLERRLRSRAPLLYRRTKTTRLRKSQRASP
jgi:hypothetical protein